MPRSKTAQTVSAGGVVYRQVDGLIQVVLVGQTDRGIWGLPKGGPHKGETTEETALREVREETGLITRLDRSLGSIEYWFFSRGTRFHKTVHYFLMEAVGGDYGLPRPRIRQRGLVRRRRCDRALPLTKTSAS